LPSKKTVRPFNEQYAKLETVGDLDAIVAADKLKSQFPEEVKPLHLTTKMVH
jgi:hypothetical protein